MKQFVWFRVFFSCGLLLATPLWCPGQQGAGLPPFEAIPVKEGGRLEKDFRAAERAWAASLLNAARSSWKNRDWESEAAALMEAAFEQLESERLVTRPLAPFAGRFREMLQKAPDDPLLKVYAARAQFHERADVFECLPLVQQALSRGGLSGALEAMAQELHWQVAEADLLNDKEGEQRTASTRWLAALGRSLTDGSYDKNSVNVLVRHHVRALRTLEPEGIGPLEDYSRHVAASGLDEWAKLVLQGTVEVEIAWMKRSSDWANSVSDAQWQGFAAHLKTARDLLGRSSRLRPENPEAATLMITVAMGESVDFSEMRAWFNRAVTAQLDYMPAYTALLWAARPRWGGDLGLMLAMGKACAETRRYDTMVPFTLLTAAADVTSEVGDPHPVFRHPDVRAAIKEMCQGYLKAAAAAPPLTRQLFQSHAAMSAWLADEDDLAAEALSAAGPRLALETRALLTQTLMHERMMRAEVAADTGVYGASIRAAANPAPKSTLDAIHDAFVKVDEKGLAPDALAYLQEAREMTGLSKAIEAGGWVDLPFRKHLTAYYQSENGDWEVDEQGSLVCHGTGHPRSRFALRVPVAQDVEMKGEFSFTVPSHLEHTNTSLGVGPMLCWTPAATAGLKAMIFWLSPTSACTKAYSNSMQRSTPDITIELKEWNTFSIRRVGERLAYDINGRTIAAGVNLNDLDLGADEGLIGFSAFRMPVGSSARFRNVSLRKITAADMASAAVNPVVGASAEPVATAQGLLPEGWWKAAILVVMLIVGIYLPRWMSKPEV